MEKSQDIHFTERISTLRIWFILSGLLSFFGYNNYAPFSYFTMLSSEPMQSFFNPDISWFAFVLTWSLILVAISIRFFRLNKEIPHKGYRRFSLLYMLSNILTLTMFSLLLILSLAVPWSIYYPYQTEIGLGYLCINSVIQILQILAWVYFYNISREQDSKLAQSMQVVFGKVPILFILGNCIFLGAMVLSFISTFNLFTGNFPRGLSLATFGTYASFGWVLCITLGHLVVGFRIQNKPLATTEKTLATKHVELKKVKQSCPVCRNPIYEGQNACKNCGYRIL